MVGVDRACTRALLCACAGERNLLSAKAGATRLGRGRAVRAKEGCRTLEVTPGLVMSSSMKEEHRYGPAIGAEVSNVLADKAS